VAASGAFLRIVSVQRSWRDEYNQQKTRADVAALTASQAKIGLGQKVAELAKAKADAEAQKKLVDVERTGRAADKAAAALAAGVNQGNFDSLKASLTELRKDLETSLEMQKQLSAEKGVLAKNLETANEAARGLKKDFDEASVQIRRLNTMVQHYALLIKDLRGENKELQAELARRPEASGSSNTVAAAPVTAPGQTVSGRITAVHSGVASINIGRAKGIQEKMLLKVFRGGKFVSHLRIDLVEPDSAAGVILDKKLEVQQGDEVATSLK